MERTWQEEEGCSGVSEALPILPIFQVRKREDSGWAGSHQLFESCSVALQLVFMTQFSSSSQRSSRSPQSSSLQSSSRGAPRQQLEPPECWPPPLSQQPEPGVGVEEICEACGGSGSSLHPQSCSSFHSPELQQPLSWGHSRKTLEGDTGWALGRTLLGVHLGGHLGDTWAGAGTAAGFAGRTSWQELNGAGRKLEKFLSLNLT